MKIRQGFVSNSSSSSFIIPSSFLSDEQKEILLSIDDSKDTKVILGEMLGIKNYLGTKSKFPKNKEYHNIYENMIKDKEWHDSPWEISFREEDGVFSGSTMMWNGSIEKLMEKIGIDITALEIINNGHNTVHMATNPLAVKFFSDFYDKLKKDIEKEDEILYNYVVENFPFAKENVYKIDKDKFKKSNQNYLYYESNGFTFFLGIDVYED